MAHLVPRRLRGALLQHLESSPVVILEGPRGVGKTTLLRQLHLDGLVARVIDCTDENVHRALLNDPEGHLVGKDLGGPVVVDEAHLVPRLLLDVKRIIDRRGGTGHFVLSGSMALLRDQLGGVDPLVGRALDLPLLPFTQGELNGTSRSPAAYLWEGRFQPGEGERLPLPQLCTMLASGGLPVTPGVVDTAAQRAPTHFETYLRRLVDSASQREDRDAVTMLDVLRLLLSRSAGVLNVTQVASDLAITRTTVTRHLAALQDVFAVRTVPAHRPTAGQRARAHGKTHAVDPGFAVWAQGLDASSLEDQPAVVGQLAETLVHHELLASLPWDALTTGIEVRHWRQSNRDDVDLVLVKDGRSVGVEVKSSAAVRTDDARGLSALARRAGLGEMTHGVVLYRGSTRFELQRVGDAPIWAIPLTDLWAPTHDDRERINVVHAPDETAIVFLSYARDDDRDDGGHIVEMARHLERRLRAHGSNIVVFEDRGLEWGEEWQQRLDDELARTTFFMPVITPRFFASDACRQEAQDFLQRLDRGGLDSALVVPILWRDPLDQPDQLRELLDRFQWEDWRELQYDDLTAPSTRRELDGMAKRLIDAAAVPAAPATAATSTDDTAALDELLEAADAAMQRLDGELAGFDQHVRPLMDGITALPLEPGTPRSQLVAHAHRLSPQVVAAEQWATRTQADLRVVDQLGVALVDVARNMDRALRKEVGLTDALRSLASIAEVEDLAEMRTQAPQMRQVVGLLSAMSRSLRGPTRALTAAIAVFEDVVEMADRWAALAGPLLKD